jgi:hypothetical protein
MALRCSTSDYRVSYWLSMFYLIDCQSFGRRMVQLEELLLTSHTNATSAPRNHDHMSPRTYVPESRLPQNIQVDIRHLLSFPEVEPICVGRGLLWKYRERLIGNRPEKLGES